MAKKRMVIDGVDTRTEIEYDAEVYRKPKLKKLIKREIDCGGIRQAKEYFSNDIEGGLMRFLKSIS